MTEIAPKVVAMFGQPIPTGEPVPECVVALEEWLEMARSGEIVGVAMAGLCADGLARRQIGGHVGGYAIIGAASVNLAALQDHIEHHEQ